MEVLANKDAIFKTIYGEMYQYDQAFEVDIDVKDTWYDIANMTAGELNGFVLIDNKELRCDRKGKYSARWSCCWTDGVSTLYKFRLAINGTTVGKTQSCGRKGNATNIVSSGSGGILALNANDRVTLQVMNATNTNDPTIINVNITLHRTGDGPND